MESQISTPQMQFAQRLSATRRGARLARRLVAHQLDLWGIPHGSDLSDAAAQITAELAANAVTHGHVPGRDFELRLAYAESTRTLRIEVSDARGDRVPELRPPDPVAEAGRGLRIVEATAATWGVTERRIGKTVWAELRDPSPELSFARSGWEVNPPADVAADAARVAAGLGPRGRG